ncbi:MAG: hypothetical protein ACWA5Q_00040 [bacterium]
MTAATLGLVAGFVFLVSLLLIMVVKTPYHWIAKAVVTIAAVGFYLLMLDSLPGFYGWPVADKLPPKFQLISMDVQEPQNEADKGAIYMWVIPLPSGDNKPRAYQVNYSRELHTLLVDAKGRMDLGQPLAGEMQTGEEGGTKRGGLPRFYFLERQKLPPKE